MSTERHSKPVGLGDIMQVPGHRKGQQMMLNAQVEFINGCENLWDGVYQLDLIVDSTDFYGQFLKQNQKKKYIKIPMKIHKVENQQLIGHFIMYGTVDGTEYVLKCASKKIVNAATALFESNRVMSSIENEVFNYKYVSSKPKLQESFLRMFAHGHFLELAGNPMNDYVIRQWDCIILEKGSALDLFKFVRDKRLSLNGHPQAEFDTALQRIIQLTFCCFDLQRKMHDYEIVHGDLKIDQFLWQNDQEQGSNNLKLIDLERALLVGSSDPLTKNLRMIMDISFLLIANPINVFAYGFPNLRSYNMQEIRKRLQSPPGLDLKQYIIPDIFMWNSSYMIVDENSSTFFCKKYYRDENFQFLRNLDLEKFTLYLTTGNNLLKLIMQIADHAKQTMLPERRHDELIQIHDIPHPSYEDTELKYKAKDVQPKILVPSKVVDDIEARQRQARQQPMPMPPPPPPAAAVPPPVPVPQNASSVKYPLNFQGHGIFNQRGQPIQIQITSDAANISGTEGYDLNHLIPAFAIVNMQLSPFLVNHAMAIQHLHWRVQGENVEFWAVNPIGQQSFIARQNLFG
jgi:hypothetical protein